MSKRSSSGTRNGTHAMIRTLEDMKNATRKNATAENFKLKFDQFFRQDYADAAPSEIEKVRKNLSENHDWGNGLKLGKNLGDVIKSLKNDNLLDQIQQGEEKKQQHSERVKQDVEETNVRGKLEQEEQRKMGVFEAVLKRKLKQTDTPETIKKKVEALENKNLMKKYTKLLMEKRDKQKLSKAQQAELDALEEEIGSRKEALTDTFVEEFNKQREQMKEYEQREKQEAENITKSRKQYEEELTTHEAKVKQQQHSTPPDPDDYPNIKPRKPKAFEADEAAQKQFKKIDRKNVKKIDENVKVEKDDLNTHVKPTIRVSDVQKALQKHNNRMKLSHAKITYHRLGIAKDTRNTF